jgi:hypothetical protein
MEYRHDLKFESTGERYSDSESKVRPGSRAGVLRQARYASSDLLLLVRKNAPAAFAAINFVSRNDVRRATERWPPTYDELRINRALGNCRPMNSKQAASVNSRYFGLVSIVGH